MINMKGTILLAGTVDMQVLVQVLTVGIVDILVLVQLIYMCWYI